jgi:hypothetical protein
MQNSSSNTLLCVKSIWSNSVRDLSSAYGTRVPQEMGIKMRT